MKISTATRRCFLIWTAVSLVALWSVTVSVVIATTTAADTQTGNAGLRTGRSSRISRPFDDVTLSSSSNHFGRSRRQRVVAATVVAPTTNAILRFELVNSMTDETVMDLINGTVVVVSDIEGMKRPSFNILATTTINNDQTTVQSVSFAYNNKAPHRIEYAPFAFCGHYNATTNFARCPRLSKYGTHTVTAVAYAQNRARGNPIGEPYTVTFTVVPNADDENQAPASAPSSNAEVGAVTALQLINSRTDTDIVALVNGATIRLDDWGMTTPTFNIRAEIKDGDTIQSIVFSHNRIPVHFIANATTGTTTTFTFCGLGKDRNGDFGSKTINYKRCRRLGLGQHAVTATPYSQQAGRGRAGTPYTVRFTIVNDGEDGDTEPSPTRSPGRAPVAVPVPVAAPVAAPVAVGRSLALLDFTAVTPTSVNATTVSTIQFTAAATYNEYLYGYVNGYYADDPVPATEAALAASIYDAKPGEPFLVTLEIPWNVRPGNYVLQVTISDSNLSETVTYNTQELAALGFASSVEVFNPRFDETPPTVLDVVAVTSTTIDVSFNSAVVNFQVAVLDNMSGRLFGQMEVKRPDPDANDEQFISFDSGTAPTNTRVAINVSVPFERFIAPGQFELALSLRDDFGNSLYLTTEDLVRLGYPSFIDVVNINIDVSPPEIRDLDVLGPKTVNVTDGAALVRLQLTASDAGVSGLDRGYLSFSSDVGFESLWEGFSFTNGPFSEATINVTISVPQIAAPGTYSVSQVALYDRAGNYNFIDSASFSFPTFTVISLRFDDQPPELQRFSALSPLTVDVSNGPAIVTFKIVARDVINTVKDSSLELLKEDTGAAVAETIFARGPRTAGADASFVFNLTIPQYLREGSYRLQLYLYDSERNYKSFDKELLRALRYPAIIKVKNAVEDATPPELLNMTTISGSTLVDVSSGSAILQFQLTMRDNLSGLRVASVDLTVRGMSMFSVRTPLVTRIGAPYTYNATFEFDQRVSRGTYSIEVTMVDEAFNEITLRSYDLSPLGFPYSVEIVNSQSDVEAPLLERVIALSPLLVDVSLEPAQVELQLVVTPEYFGAMVNVVDLVEGRNISTATISNASGAGVPTVSNVTLTIPRYIPNGLYKIALYYLANAETNEYRSFNADAFISLEVTNTNVDTVQPKLLDFSVSPVEVGASTGKTSIRFQLIASDDLSGIQFISVKLTGPPAYIEASPFGYDEVRDFTFNAPTDGTTTVNSTFSFEEEFEWSESFRFEVYIIDVATNVAKFEAEDLAALGFVGTLPRTRFG